MKQHQITINDIARELNISKSTVSRALTGHPKVSPAKRTAILELAEKLDYQRNMLAISLCNNRTNTIGVIVPEFRTSFFPKILVAIQETAAQSGYNVIVCQSGESYETEVKNTKVMLTNHVDGLIISITKETKNYEHLKIFQRKGIPLVFINRIVNEMAVPKVVVDDYEGAFRAVEHLIQTGKKRIAHLAGPENLLISRNRLNGYLDALRKYNLPIIQELIIPYDFNLEKVKIYTKHLLELKERPDALFAINDPTAVEAIQVIKAKKLKIPKDIAVVGFSNEYSSAYIDPSLTTVAQPLEEMGIRATQALIEQLNKDISEWKAVTQVLKPELIIRKSS
ncbi:LacI family DNA-binding transcriptional regulator [Chitinophaga barathri]|uniref:LacI family transcriptional regulator n=1 Tax=Chitinophaga barathri TaxID=1647451 RepID=A0A3N4MLR7_9BACT|nr:LacI family DNA-binding transcriptional regulator [Chitinophaga barathri]RPD43006.1 LacI family transcriptional regulator [Chitinophaga barathri]